jgi:glycosyltransferase involved in cell wall biosynthesis
MINRPIKALQRLGSLNRGGIETWMLNLVRMRPAELHIDFVVEVPNGTYEEEIKSLGRLVHTIPPMRQLRRNLNSLHELLVLHNYDVFHMHGEEFLGDAMKAASGANVPVRVAHCHGTVLARGKSGLEMMVRRVRHRTLERWRTLRYATDIVACSHDAGRFLVGSTWGNDPRCATHYCGIPLDNFSASLATHNRTKYRASLGIPEDAVVIGHAGSMGPTPIKNHEFLVEVFHELSKRCDRYWLFMAGDGTLRPGIEQLVKKRGLAQRVVMPGLFADVPSLMVHVFDVHVLPSFREGLPLVGLEATAAGLFTVCTDTMAPELTDYFPERVEKLSLGAGAETWANRVEQAIGKRVPPEKGMALVEKSPFAIQSSLRGLIDLYQKRLRANSP